MAARFEQLCCASRSVRKIAVKYYLASGDGFSLALTRRLLAWGARRADRRVRARRIAVERLAVVRFEGGYSTLLIDLQATGESPGEAITFEWRERLDVLAAFSRPDMMPRERIAIAGISRQKADTRALYTSAPEPQKAVIGYPAPRT